MDPARLPFDTTLYQPEGSGTGCNMNRVFSLAQTMEVSGATTTTTSSPTEEQWPLNMEVSPPNVPLLGHYSVHVAYFPPNLK